MKRLNHNQLYYFHVVAEEAGLAKGAKRLGMAQSTLSEHLRTLEGALRVRLFNRAGAGLTLTDAGRTAFEQTEKMFEASARLQEALCGAGAEQIVVPIGVASTVSRSLAAELFVPLFKTPDLRVRICHGDHTMLQQQLVAGELEVLLTDVSTATLQSKGLSSTTIRCPRMVVVAGGELAARMKSSPAGLDQMPYVAYTLHSRYRGEIDEYFERNKVSPRLLGEVDDVAIMLELCRANHCFAILPESVAADWVREGTLKVLGDVDGLRSNVEAVFVHKNPSAEIQRIVELLSRVDECSEESQARPQRA